MRNAPAVVALSACLALLAGCACEGGGSMAPAREGGAMSAAAPGPADRKPAGVAAGGEARAAQEPAAGAGSSGGSGSDAQPLGLFAPVLPTLGMDTHSTDCDPFEDPYQVCL